MTSTEIVLLRRWKALWPGHPLAAESFTSLSRKYIANQLPYHNLDHIRSCLELLDGFESMAIDKRPVELALWYHDIVYDSRRKDNEAASADFAAGELTKLGLTGYQCAHVMRLIIATKHDKAPVDPDAMLIVDIDLAILGASETAYAQYARAIRKEYGWVSDADYRAGRAQVMQTFLDRPQIYMTRKFQTEREARARANIAQELARL